MTQTMKPRQIFTAAKAGKVTEIEIRGEWHAITSKSLMLIGSSKWTIYNGSCEDLDSTVLTSCSGNTAFQVR